jgi:FkbM family methyltransferase
MLLVNFAEIALRAMLGAPIRFTQRLLADPAFREFQVARASLSRLPRFQEVRTKLGGYDLLAPDAASLLSSWEEIFLKAVYDFPIAGKQPRILDLGANIGLSVLYFKRRFPHAQVVAYEADPEIFAYLERNITVNGAAQGVTLVNRAVWDRDETLRFWSEGADGGRIEEGAGVATKELQAVDIATALAGQSFDFIKMDIEGAESRVLPRCAQLLEGARAVFIEYHSRPGDPEALADILALLRTAGFRVQLSPLYQNPTPFHPIIANGFDQQLNLFAVR